MPQDAKRLFLVWRSDTRRLRISYSIAALIRSKTNFTKTIFDEVAVLQEQRITNPLQHRFEHQSKNRHRGHPIERNVVSTAHLTQLSFCVFSNVSMISICRTKMLAAGMQRQFYQGLGWIG